MVQDGLLQVKLQYITSATVLSRASITFFNSLLLSTDNPIYTALIRSNRICEGYSNLYLYLMYLPANFCHEISTN